MSRPINVPSYRRHKQSGQAVVTLTDGLGGRHDVLLGKYNTSESRIEYARVLAEWEAKGRRLHTPTESDSLSIDELILSFWKHAQHHYRRADGTLTNEMSEYRGAFKPLKELYGTLPVADFGPLKLKAVRQRMADARRYRVRFTDDDQARERWVWEQSFRRKDTGCEALWGKMWRPVEVLSEKKAQTRGVINKRISRIVHMFKWATSEELVPESVWRALTTVRGLEKGRTEVVETRTAAE